MTTRILVLVGVLMGSGCAMSQPGPLLPPTPDEAAPCRAATLQGQPVVAEWSAPEKASLEAMLTAVAVAVEFHGCSMRVVTTCRLPGRYLWYRTTLATDSSDISDERSLWAKLPLGAASLSGELKAAGKLAIKTSVAGQIRLEEARPDLVPRTPGCERATHIVESVAIGAYSLSRSGSLQGKAGVEVVKLDVGGKHNREASMIRSAGDPDACGRATEQGPDKDCSSPIQVFLLPIPGRAQYVGPVGTVPVEFLSADDRRWDVHYENQTICTTPCSRWLDPSRPLLLATRDNSFFQREDRIILSSLGDSGRGAGGLSVVANTSSRGKMAGGATAATFGGMGVAASIALYAVGRAIDKPMMESAGIYAIGPSILVLGLGIYLLLDAGPYAKVRPIGSSTLVLAPGGMAGTF